MKTYYWRARRAEQKYRKNNLKSLKILNFNVGFELSALNNHMSKITYIVAILFLIF